MTAINQPSEPAESSSQFVMRKLPHVTVLFWIIKIVATTLGETGGDLLAQTLQVGYLVVQARLRFQLEENPADVGVEKAFRDVIRIVVLIHKFMVTAMVGGPVQDRVFKSGGAEQQREQAHRPARLKCSMGKEAMVAERDAEAGAPKKDNEQRCLKPVQAIAPQISRNCGQRCEQRADQKQAVLPVNGLPRNTIHTKFCFNTRRYD